MLQKFRVGLTWFSVIILALVFNFTATPPIYGAEEVDQYCTPGDAWVTVSGHSDISQTFTPSQNRLSRVGVWVEGDGDGTVYLRILKNNVTIGSGSRSEPSEYSLIYFDFDDLTLEPGNSNYRIKLTTGPGNTSLRWHRSSSSGCCASGHALLDGTIKDYDWGFATYGWTYTSDEEEDSSDSSQPSSDSNNQTNDQTSSTVGTSEAPSENVNYNISPPNELTITDVPEDQGNQLKLTWKKSDTSNIDGYKVFRSEEKESGFRNIGYSKQNITSYLDRTVVPEKDYYYFIRAYQNNEESASSETVKAASIDNLAPVTPVNFVILKSSEKYVKLGWDANTEEDLEKYILLVVDPTRGEEQDQVLRIEVDKDQTEYQLNFADHSEIEYGKDYQFYLQAQDSHDNYSEKAGPVQASTSNEQEAAQRTIMWYISLGILAVLLAVLIFLLYKMRKNKKSKQETNQEKK